MTIHLSLSFFEEELRELFRYLIDNGKTMMNTSAYRALPETRCTASTD